MEQSGDLTDTPKESKPFLGKIRPLKKEDLVHLRPILETWIRDRNTGEIIPDEINGVLAKMEESIDNQSERIYLVAEDLNRLIGVVGLTSMPNPRMSNFFKTQNPAELINFNIDKDYRGKGVGKALVNELEKQALQQGYTEIILNSGPRYKDTAWGFYDKLFGPIVGVAQEMYGLGGDAQVWSKVL